MNEKSDFDRYVEANFHWNFAANLLDITFITIGHHLISRETIVPLLVSQLTSSKLAIGLIPAIFSLGTLLPQLLVANFAERLPRKKPFVMVLGAFGERLPHLLIGLAVWSLAASSPTAALIALFLLTGISAASMGIATPPWYDLIAKVIPLRKRGLWSGAARSLGALVGIAGAWLSGRILQSLAFPRNFALCYFLAFGAMVVSWVGLALNREPESPIVKGRSTLGQFLGRLPGVLRRDANYRRFLISRSLANLGGMAAGFFIVYGSERFAIGGAEVGALTAALVGSQALMNLVLGMAGDRTGHKGVLCAAAFSMALAAVAALAASSSAWLWAVFVLLGVSLAADHVSGLNIILEFCAAEERPTYIGLTNTLLAPSRALAPILGGWLATWSGYRGLFAGALVASVLGGALLTMWVQEPRLASQGEGQAAA